MSAKSIVSRAVILAVLGGWTARAAAQTPEISGQVPPEQLPAPTAPATSPLPAVMTPPSQIPAMRAGLPPGSVPDPWITYDRPGCCGPIGADGPIDSELYLRTGPSIATGNSIIRRSENTGWMAEVGGRTLLFNRETTAAWTGDFGISYTYNDAGGNIAFPLLVPFNVTTTNPLTLQTTTTVQRVPLQVSIRDYQRVAPTFAFGREWYIGQPAYCLGSHWRVGADIGGRWGTSRLELNDMSIPGRVDFRHLSDVYGSALVSIHSDLEFPLTACSWLIVGARAEWAYNWSDILKDAFPRQASDTQEINLLLNVGIRF
jgi:hypothetical protein